MGNLKSDRSLGSPWRLLSLWSSNIHALCLQETHWKASMTSEIGEGVKLFYNVEDTKRNGGAIVATDSLKRSVLAFNRISSRVMTVRVDLKGRCSG